ncbi:unnamed protein product [Orchesella dallaii]|uniref:Pro-Pol polyprotein n=1 Tax=Orchesella dallaii TaxID=48710 RepID=A0ABP1RLE0_9HEXA
MYVDDLLGGEKTTDEAKSLAKDIRSLMEAGAMKIRKWCSNSDEVMQSIPPELRETGTELAFDEDSSIKALGIIWHPRSDSFLFKVNSKSTACTKRELLSEIAKTFDPLGWLSPITINAKILFQELWQAQYGWDDVLHGTYQERWSQHQQQLHLLASLRIPRCVITPNTTDFQLYGFSDASEKAYAAAVYLRCLSHDGQLVTNLLTSKTKVAPLKQVSLPRLELCGALLLAETIDATLQAIKLKCSIKCFTDSMIVLKWISSSSRRWKTFVANRVAAIQELVPGDLWYHVRSEENPADLPSRGVNSEELINSRLWWHGPEWLSTEANPSVSSGHLNTEAVQREERPKILLTHHATSTLPFITSWTEKFSCLRKLVTTTAVFRMFIMFLKNKDSIIQFNSLVPASERRNALHLLIKLLQGHHFKDEVKKMVNREEIPHHSKLIKLTPYIDEEGLIRVEGRLHHAPIPVSRQHPIILPKSSHLTNLIIRDVHERHYHSGNNLTCTSLLYNYWIIGAKDAVRFNLRRCIRCRKVKASTMQQLMGSLPVGRVSANRPFLHTGVDFAGPFQIKMRRGRGASCDKVYFAVFVCFSTKAVHLEAVTSLTTEAFIAAFRRFTARRGFCCHIYSDCGTNFVGAD